MSGNFLIKIIQVHYDAAMVHKLCNWQSTRMIMEPLDLLVKKVGKTLNNSLYSQ